MAAVIADPGGGVFISDPKKPAGGHVLAHAATVRLMFRKGKGEQRVCKVFDAPNLPESEAISFSAYMIITLDHIYCLFKKLISSIKSGKKKKQNKNLVYCHPKNVLNKSKLADFLNTATYFR